jgi:hypothetical protein
MILCSLPLVASGVGSSTEKGGKRWKLTWDKRKGQRGERDKRKGKGVGAPGKKRGTRGKGKDGEGTGTGSTNRTGARS